MVLDWFRRNVTVPELIAKKEFVKAIELARRQLEDEPQDKRLRLQLADALAVGGEAKEAIAVLTKLADEYGGEGYATKAIALLKKIQKLDPGRSDIEQKLATMISSKQEEARVEAGAEGAAKGGIWWIPPQASAKLRPGVAPAPEMGEAPAPAAATPQAPASISGTPLFSAFSEEELLEIIRGLNLLSFEPGEIIVTEGEAGHSLFVVTEGWVRIFVRNAAGRNVQLREMGDGSFFGEISILAGKLRTATITARTHCELLELDRATLDTISQKHPHVQKVLEDFYEQRAHNVEEVLIRGESGQGA